MTRTLVVILLAGVLLPAGAAAQDPPVDSTGVPLDSVAPGRPDSLRARPDSLAVADTVPVFHNLPELPDHIREGWDGAVWTWDHERLMASGAHTLVELLDDVPGVVPLIAGDYGTPAAFSALGHAAGGIRVVRDGFELMPLSGGVVDLQRVGLGGIERVRLHRNGGRIVVEMWSLDFDDPRPYSLVEAGTGDLDNNLFRGAFTAPNALGGSVALALERSDTRGAGARETGSRTGSWVRYQLNRGDDAGIAIEFRRMGSRSEVAEYPSPATRTDLNLRARARLAEGVVAELQAGRSSLDVEDERLLYALDGGRRNQYAARVAANRGDIWADGAFRLFEGDDLLENRLDLEGGWRLPEVGGLSARLTREDWKGARPVSWGLSGWARPVSWMTVFGSWADGAYGARSAPVQEATPPAPDPGVPDPLSPAWDARPTPVLWTTDRTSYRAGASLGWGGAVVSAAVLGLEHDVALPLGLEPDLGSEPVAGAKRRGWEAYGRIPLLFEGLALVGSYQAWDVAGPYLPARIYRGAFDFHRTFMESENFEIRATLGVRGHDPMLVFVPPDDASGAPELVEVPFFQSWDGGFQMRIVTVRIFVAWENLTVRRNLQLFPGRVLTALRTSYGIRWTMRN